MLGLSIFIIAVLLSCSNQKQEERIKDLEQKLAQLDPDSVESQETNVKKDLNTDEKFIGRWKYYKMSPAAKDNSMNGIICNLEKYQNTNETYVFHLYTGNDLILSIKDKNTLKGENANINVVYDPKLDLLKLVMSSGNKTIFRRLK